ncbi:hypothetical protein GCM10020295_28950 [Streptomyces cinereospinus]
MAGTKGKQQTVRDMVLSLGLIVLAGMVMYLFVPHDDDQEPDIQRVDYRIEVITARRAAAYPVAAPQGLPQTWKATSVRFDGQEHDTWHLGFHAPDGEYVTVKQSTGKRIPFIEEATQGGAGDGGHRGDRRPHLGPLHRRPVRRAGPGGGRRHQGHDHGGGRHRLVRPAGDDGEGAQDVVTPQSWRHGRGPRRQPGASPVVRGPVTRW